MDFTSWDAASFELAPLKQTDGFAITPSAAAGVPITIQIDVTKVVNAISNAYTQTTIAREEKKTERERLRTAAACFTEMLQHETRRYEVKIQALQAERMPLVQTVCALASRPDIAPETVELVKWILHYLSENSKALDFESTELPNAHF